MMDKHRISDAPNPLKPAALSAALAAITARLRPSERSRQTIQESTRD